MSIILFFRKPIRDFLRIIKISVFLCIIFPFDIPAQETGNVYVGIPFGNQSIEDKKLALWWNEYAREKYSSFVSRHKDFGYELSETRVIPLKSGDDICRRGSLAAAFDGIVGLCLKNFFIYSSALLSSKAAKNIDREQGVENMPYPTEEFLKKTIADWRSSYIVDGNETNLVCNAFSLILWGKDCLKKIKSSDYFTSNYLDMFDGNNSLTVNRQDAALLERIMRSLVELKISFLILHESHHLFQNKNKSIDAKLDNYLDELEADEFSIKILLELGVDPILAVEAANSLALEKYYISDVVFSGAKYRHPAFPLKRVYDIKERTSNILCGHRRDGLIGALNSLVTSKKNYYLKKFVLEEFSWTPRAGKINGEVIDLYRRKIIRLKDNKIKKLLALLIYNDCHENKMCNKSKDLENFFNKNLIRIQRLFSMNGSFDSGLLDELNLNEHELEKVITQSSDFYFCQKRGQVSKIVYGDAELIDDTYKLIFWYFDKNANP